MEICQRHHQSSTKNHNRKEQIDCQKQVCSTFLRIYQQKLILLPFIQNMTNDIVLKQINNKMSKSTCSCKRIANITYFNNLT